MSKLLTVHTVEVSPTVALGLRRNTFKQISNDALYRKALEQHEKLRDALCAMGAVSIHHSVCVNGCHDTHFVEDLATILRNRHSNQRVALLHRVGAAQRRGEVAHIAPHAQNWADETIDLRTVGDHTTTVDGGDLKVVGDVIFAGYGISQEHAPRTTLPGILQLMGIVAPMGYTVVPIAHRSLHFTTECGFFGRSPRDGRPVMTMNPSMLEKPLEQLRKLRIFGEPLDIIEVPHDEVMGGNGIGFNGQAIVQRGFPSIAEALNSRGFKLHELDFSAFQSVDGGPSCLCAFEDDPLSVAV